MLIVIKGTLIPLTFIIYIYDFFSRFHTDANFAREAKMIVSLAFLPIERVVDGLESLLANFPQELVAVLQWFRYHYVEG